MVEAESGWSVVLQTELKRQRKTKLEYQNVNGERGRGYQTAQSLVTCKRRELQERGQTQAKHKDSNSNESMPGGKWASNLKTSFKGGSSRKFA